MRRLAYLVLLLAPLALLNTGCGGGASDEGVPADVDMSKDFTPPVEMPGMSPQMATQGKRDAAKASK